MTEAALSALDQWALLSAVVAVATFVVVASRRRVRAGDPADEAGASASAPPSSETASAGIHIHEDDWGMRSLHPIDALSEVSSDVAEAVASGERNLSPDGLGWTDLHIIRAPSSSYADHGLTVTRAGAVLEAMLPRVRRFTATAMAGFSGHDALGSYETDAWAFGYGPDCFVKLDTDSRGGGPFVVAIWFECRTNDPEQREALRGALLALDAVVPSVVADYILDIVGIVRDPAFIVDYFRALAGEDDAVE